MARGIKYTPDRSGLHELAQGSAVSAMSVAAAQVGAAWANTQNPAGQYEASSATVTGGWNNERRAGAAITETKPSWRGARDRVLDRAANVIESK